ncbi:MAG: VCBS repeat-containing protein, partial [Bacteroidales bacterium]|nr:VCBS repeat-containing protein [Bacteroidales bacterium]
YYKLLKKYRNLYTRIKEMFNNGTFFQLEIRTRKTLFRKFKLLYSRLKKIQLSTGIKTAGVAMAFTLISSVASGQSVVRKWVENPQGTALFNSPIYIGDREIAAFVDIDGDGDEDLFLGGNKGYSVYKFYRNQGINAPERFVFDDHTVDTLGVLPFISNSYRTSYLAFIDNDNDNDLDIYATDPENSGSIVLYKNTSNADTLRFELATGTENRFSAYSSIFSIAFADIDADNDIDALLLTDSDTVRYFQYSADTFIEQLGTNNPFSGLTLENPTMDFRDLDGDNDIDAIAHDWKRLVFLENTTSNGHQQFVINSTNIITDAIGGTHLVPVFVDLDEDNDKDLFISDYTLSTINNFYYYQYNANDSTFRGAASGITTPVRNFGGDITRFIDFDMDGDLDLYIDNISNNYPPPTRLFINAGTSTNPKFQQAPIDAFRIPYILTETISFTEAFADIDGDGDLDMFYTHGANPIVMYKNVGSVAEPNFELQNNDNNPLSGINASNSYDNLVFEDINGDGDLDLVTAIQGQSPFIKIHENTGTTTNAVFSQITLSPDPFSSIPSHTAYTLNFFDFDNDNKRDLIIGTYHATDSGVYKIFRNTSTTTNISFELMTESPLAEFYSGEGLFAMVNLFGETSPSIIIDEVGGTGNSLDSIKYYNYIDFLSINQQTFSIDERSAVGTLVGRINYNYAGDSTLLFSITGGNTDNAFQITGDSITVLNPSAIN